MPGRDMVDALATGTNVPLDVAVCGGLLWSIVEDAEAIVVLGEVVEVGDHLVQSISPLNIMYFFLGTKSLAMRCASRIAS